MVAVALSPAAAGAAGDEDGRGHVEAGDLALVEALGEMERQDALEDPEREDRKQDRRRGELEATGAQYLPIGRE